jgi:hypothetical protein
MAKNNENVHKFWQGFNQTMTLQKKKKKVRVTVRSLNDFVASGLNPL